MPFSRCLSRLWLPKRVYFPASFARSGQQSFDARHEIRSRYLKNLGKFEDGGKRRTVLAAFQQAYVLRVVATFEGKRFLREMTLLPQLTEGPRKCPLLWRTLFVFGWHPQLGVCGLSVNTSTKYSIPLQKGVYGRNAAKMHAREAA
jgi:hypothetical protein